MSGESLPPFSSPESESHKLAELLFADLLGQTNAIVVTELFVIAQKNIDEGFDGASMAIDGEEEHVISIRSDGQVHLRYGGSEKPEFMTLPLQRARQIVEEIAELQKAQNPN